VRHRRFAKLVALWSAFFLMKFPIGNEIYIVITCHPMLKKLTLAINNKNKRLNIQVMNVISGFHVK